TARAEEIARKRLGPTEVQAPPAEDRGAPRRAPVAPRTDGDDDERPARSALGGRVKTGRAPVAEVKPARKDVPDRSGRSRLTLTNALDDSERERSVAAWKRKQERIRARSRQPVQREKVTREVVVPETITIQELSNRMAERANAIIG